MGSDERELEDLLRIQKRRLAQLRKQAARTGYDAPPELLNEIEDLQKATDSSKQVIEPIVRGELPDDIMAALRAYGVPASVSNALQLVEAAIYEVKKALEGQKQEVHALKDQVMPIVADVQALKIDNLEGKRGRMRNYRLFLIVIVLLVVIVAVVVPTAARVFWGGR